MGRRTFLIVILIAIAMGANAAAPRVDAHARTWQPPAADLPVQLAGLLRATLFAARDDDPDHRAWDELERFYASRAFQPAWLSAEQRDAARVLAGRMAAADQDGLDPTVYGAWTDRLAEPAVTLQEVARLDVQFSAAALHYAYDLARGYGDPGESQRAIDPVSTLLSVRDSASARNAIDALEPAHAAYRDLRRALAQYRQIETNGGWPRVPADVVLRVEPSEPQAQNQAAVGAVCRRLLATRELGATTGALPPACRQPSPAAGYDEALAQAVRLFQERHGLASDGIVGPNTAAAMNVPVHERISQIAVNMNRWRRLPDDLGDRHVLVNIPAFWLQARDPDGVQLSMRVVAGGPETPTPVMSDRIQYLVFRPYWNVPASITRGELLPEIRRDRDYLRRQHLEVVDGWTDPANVVDPSTVDWAGSVESFPYRLRQRPGSHNSLGLVKFMFPNEYSVYLHDTPATHRFEERRRAFSHGCVRVEDPVALAEFLLADEQWPGATIRSAMDSGERQVVPLDDTVPVHLTYFTAWTENGLAHFRGDIYALDARPLSTGGTDPAGSDSGV